MNTSLTLTPEVEEQQTHDEADGYYIGHPYSVEFVIGEQTETCVFVPMAPPFVETDGTLAVAGFALNPEGGMTMAVVQGEELGHPLPGVVTDYLPADMLDALHKMQEQAQGQMPSPQMPPLPSDGDLTGIGMYL